eukprot:gene4868-5113_t
MYRASGPGLLALLTQCWLCGAIRHYSIGDVFQQPQTEASSTHAESGLLLTQPKYAAATAGHAGLLQQSSLTKNFARLHRNRSEGSDSNKFNKQHGADAVPQLHIKARRFSGSLDQVSPSASSSRHNAITTWRAQGMKSRVLQQLGDTTTEGVALPLPLGSGGTYTGTAPTTLAGLLASLAGNLVLWDSSSSAGSSGSVSTIPSNQRKPPARSPSTGAASITLQVFFEPAGLSNVSLRLPQQSRTFQVLVCSSSADGACSSADLVCSSYALAYRDQTVDCHDMIPGVNYTAVVLDSDDEGLQLASRQFMASDGLLQPVVVTMGMLELEASFDSLAWAGTPYPPKQDSSPLLIHAQIVGAMMNVYTTGRQKMPWDTQWTGDDGTAVFFIPPGSTVFMANMSVGEAVLQSVPIMLRAGEQQGRLQVQAQPQLLCTGEVETVRASAGVFPSNLSYLASEQQHAYHPRGFFCRWELVPEHPELMLTVNYANLLPDESVTLYLSPENVVRLERPADLSKGGRFEVSAWVDHSVFVEFQTTRTSTFDVGGFSVHFSSSSPGNKGILDSRTMVVVLACVSAAGAVLAAVCFYCVLCNNRRRRGVVVAEGAASAEHQVRLLRVPSAVRALLPSKPYQLPQNPLPGAETEPDCCSICLVELEAGEHLTVLPCMHFYHKVCPSGP